MNIRICQACGVHKNYCECKGLGIRTPPPKPQQPSPLRKRCQAITRSPSPIRSSARSYVHVKVPGRRQCLNWALPPTSFCSTHQEKEKNNKKK